MFLQSSWTFEKLSQLNVDFMKTSQNWVSRPMDLSIAPHQKWSLIYTMLNVKNVKAKKFSVDGPLHHPSETSSLKIPKNSAKKFRIMLRSSEKTETSSSLLIDKCQLKLTEPKTILLFSPPICIIQKRNNQITIFFIPQLPNITPQTIVKTIYHPYTPYLCVIYFHKLYHENWSNQQNCNLKKNKNWHL